MPKLIPEPPQKVIKRLREHGFEEHRQGATSHKQFLLRKEHGSFLVTIPMHPRDLTKREMSSIIDQTGLTKEEFYTKQKKKKR